MYKINDIDQVEPLNIYLAKPNEEILGCINDSIDETTSYLRIGLNRQFEFSCEISSNCEWFDCIQEGMYLFIEDVGFFRIDPPTLSDNINKKTKNISAKSCECELEDCSCQFSEDMGTKESLERNVVYDVSQYSNTYKDMLKDELVINPETDIPYDWIVLYNTYSEQLKKIKKDWSELYSSGDKTVSDSKKVEEILNVLNKFPRLKKRYVKKTVEKTSSSGSTTVDVTEYDIEEFVTFTYEDEAIKSVHFEDKFADRINSLIEFYKVNRNQLSLISIVLEKTNGNWTVGDIFGISDGDYSLADKKYPFNIDENIYSFLTQTFAKASECIVEFDRIKRKVNITPVENIGSDTGIVIAYDNLINSIGISPNNENTCTRLYITGADDINIEQVNFGLPYIDDLRYKMNARDNSGNLIYVSRELSHKYYAYSADVENKRKEYIAQSKIYNSTIEKIDEITYRVPLGDLKTDWGTFTEEELIETRTNYENLLNALKSLYKEEYHLQLSSEIKEDHIKGTPYWHDYKAYLNIIDEINVALDVFPYYSDQSKWENYYGDKVEEIKKKINAWETQWSLYGIKELQNKISSYQNEMKLLKDSIILDSTGNCKEWSDISDTDKAKFNFEFSIYDKNKTLYKELKNNRDEAKAYLYQLKGKTEGIPENLKVLEKRKKNAQNKRLSICQEVDLYSWNHTDIDGTTISFTKSDIKTISKLIRESSYQNNNFVVTSINTPEEIIDITNELLLDGKEKLSTYSRPQLSFNVDAENLLALPEYKPFWKDFVCGNYMTVQYDDDTYVKLRLVGYTFNPRLPAPNNFSIEFSNYILSRSKLSDLESLLGEATSSSGTSGSSAGSSSSGEYGKSEDIDIIISNTMLAKLLSSELFSTRVSDVILDTIKVNILNSQYAKFENLSTGKTIIDGGCIQTGTIKSSNYNGKSNNILSNTKGSIINLTDGTFNLGGGKLKFSNDTLYVKGEVEANSGTIGGWIINENSLANYDEDSNDEESFPDIKILLTGFPTDDENTFFNVKKSISGEREIDDLVNSSNKINAAYEYNETIFSINSIGIKQSYSDYTLNPYYEKNPLNSSKYVRTKDGCITTHNKGFQYEEKVTEYYDGNDVNPTGKLYTDAWIGYLKDENNTKDFMYLPSIGVRETDGYFPCCTYLNGNGYQYESDCIGIISGGEIVHLNFNFGDLNGCTDDCTKDLRSMLSNQSIINDDGGIYGLNMSNNICACALISTSLGIGFAGNKINETDPALSDIVSFYPIFGEDLGTPNYRWNNLYVREIHVEDSHQTAMNLGIQRGTGQAIYDPSKSYGADKDKSDADDLGNGYKKIKFGEAYKSGTTPTVVATLLIDGSPLKHALTIVSRTNEYFVVKLQHTASGSVTDSFQWIAIGTHA